jgi:hypothetical protein
VFALTACGATSAPPDATRGIAIEEGPLLSSPRATHALVRIGDGRLLAIGGCVRAGCGAGRASGTVDIIAADGLSLAGTGQLLAQRIQPAAVALRDGRVLVVGGWVDGHASATTEIYDPATGHSTAGPAMLGPRSGPTVVVLTDGRVLVAGGYDGRALRGDAEIFDPATNALTRAGALVTPRGGATGTLLADGRVLIAGGGDAEAGDRHALASAELFDPASGAFTTTGSLSQRRYKHGAVALPGGDVLVIGGSDERDYGGKLRSVERYVAAEGRFVRAGTLAVERFKLADGLLLIDPVTVLVAAGGESPELFDVAAGEGRLLAASLDGMWDYMTIARTGKSTALLAGGYREGQIEPTDRSWIVRF